MKNSKYLGKYDYINYYTKQPAFWFYANSEIQAAIETHLNYSIDVEDDIDVSLENEESDAYEFYQEQKELLKDVDKNDPNIMQGIIIDKASRAFIIETYSKLKVIDFEEEPYRFKKQEEIAVLTQAALLENENVVLFQPVFISKGLITKPDAVVKQELEISIIETKGTTTAKLHHFLDLYFQYQVLNSIEALDDFYFSMKLCLVKYCIANKSEIPFVITPYINLYKSLSLTKVTKSDRGLIKTGEYFNLNNELTLAPITIDSLCNEDLSEIEFRAELATHPQTKLWAEKVSTLLLQTFDEFWSVMKKLESHKRVLSANVDSMINGIRPHANDKSPWKTPDLFAIVKPLYIKQGYQLFNYSGNVIHQESEVLAKLKVNDQLTNLFKDEAYAKCFLETNQDVVISPSLANNLWMKLKPQKVYFDFETINTPIRPLDHTYPFMQIVTQCSIIKEHQDGHTPIDQATCNNILLDPTNIKISDFKQIVDALYEGPNYSYIVYNASFERSRLKEISEFIDETTYTSKINEIIDNLYDLACFFTPTKKQFPILIKSLGGFYSIKKVLPFIEHHYPEIFIQTGCKDYKTLPVKNGIICQTETTKRFFNLLDDQKWESLAIDLKIYCENDVRAMVAIEYFLKVILDAQVAKQD